LTGKRGLIVVISAPSGCGKTTIVERLLKRNPGFWRSISATTRPRRRGEKNRRDYYFLTRDEFFDIRKKGLFLEWAKVFGHYYGTPVEPLRQQIEKGKIAILAVDVQGAGKLRKSLPLLSMFVLPPSLKDLKLRLAKRSTDSKAEIEKRFRMARMEMREAHLYDYVVINRKISEIVEEIENILKGAQE